MSDYKTQNLINSSRPAEIGKFKNFTFAETVFDAENLSQEQLEDLNFAPKSPEYILGGVINDDDEFDSDSSVLMAIRSMYYNAYTRTYQIDGKFDGVNKWSPSRIFPTLKCINSQMFNANNKRVIFCKNNEYYRKSIADINKFHKLPSKNINKFKKTLTDNLVELIERNTFTSDSALYKFLLWTHIINNIIKPKHKTFIEGVTEDDIKNGYPEKRFYYDLKHLMKFPNTIKFSYRDLYNAYDNYFLPWLIAYIQNDYDFINLIPAVEQTVTEVEDSVMWHINHFFNEKRAQNNYKYPIVIDEKFGDYSTVKGIINLLSAAKLGKAPAPITHPIILTSMSGHCDTKVDRPGWGTGDDYFVNIEEYAFLFGLAVNEVLTCEVFAEYNRCVAVNAIMENWVVVVPPPDSSTGTTNMDFASKALREDERLNIQVESSANNPNDMRYKLRDNSEKDMIFGLDEYNWSVNTEELAEMNLTINDFQHISVYEFQPDLQVSFKRMADGFIEKSKDMLGAIAATATNELVNRVSKDIMEVRNFSTDVSWIDRLMSGYYVGKYDIPYFGNRFLSSDTTGSWSMGNLASSNEYLVNDLTMNVQDIPTWKYDQGQSKELEVTFYLLNKNIADTIKNMKFLFSFAAGTYWIQTSTIGYRSPNLYRLFCPGRFLMLYAAMGINIEFVGKVRRYTPEDAKLLFGNNTGFEPLNVMINRMSSCNIPEVYKITAKFKDLTPNAFNIQAAYFTDTQTGDGSGNINIFPKINVHTAARAVSVEGLKNYIQNGLTAAGSDISLDNNE